MLVGRELKARYRGTVLGYLWSLLNPLLLLAVYSVVFTTIMQPRFPTVEVYPLFLFAGLLPWLFASGTLLDAAVVLPDNGALLKKVVCPPEVFTAVTVLSHLVHHLLALPILLFGVTAVALAGRLAFPWTIVLLPLALLPWLVAVTGGALAISALAVHFRDLKDLLHNLLNLVFFLTPIIYPVSFVPEGPLRWVVQANPFTPLVAVYRGVVLEGRVPGLEDWLGAWLVAGVAMAGGGWIFTRLRETLAEAV
jgi:lipopolysaccharide transport system permease protein